MNANQWIGGVHAVRQALADNRVTLIEVVIDKRSKNVLAAIQEAQQKGITVNQVAWHHIDRRLPGVHHQGIAACCTCSTHAARNWQQAIAGTHVPLLLILDSLKDPHNLGACLRSALAAGVDAVLLPNNNAADISATVHKVSCGAADKLAIFRVPNLRQEVLAMKKRGIWVVGGVGTVETSIYSVDMRLPLAVIVGNEATGIRQSLRECCDFLAAIPMQPSMESLNVSVACAIILFEARRQRTLS